MVLLYSGLTSQCIVKTKKRTNPKAWCYTPDNRDWSDISLMWNANGFYRASHCIGMSMGLEEGTVRMEMRRLQLPSRRPQIPTLAFLAHMQEALILGCCMIWASPHLSGTTKSTTMARQSLMPNKQGWVTPLYKNFCRATNLKEGHCVAWAQSTVSLASWPRHQLCISIPPLRLVWCLKQIVSRIFLMYVSTHLLLQCKELAVFSIGPHVSASQVLSCHSFTF